jgi:hypothetical protein
MKRFILTAILALAIGTQADAQILRRYAPAYYSPSGAVVTSYAPSYYSSYYTPAYYAPSSVVTAGYYTPSAWNYYYPSTYVAPVYTSGYYGRWHGLFGRRGFW